MPVIPAATPDASEMSQIPLTAKFNVEEPLSIDRDSIIDVTTENKTAIPVLSKCSWFSLTPRSLRTGTTVYGCFVSGNRTMTLRLTRLDDIGKEYNNIVADRAELRVQFCKMLTKSDSRHPFHGIIRLTIYMAIF